MTEMNILYVITKLELGGAQKHLLTLMRNLNHKKYNLFLFTADSGLLMPDFLSIDNIKVRQSVFLDRPINPFRDTAALIELVNFIKKNKIQIVHTHSSKAGILGRIAAKLAGVKIVIHTVHGWSFNDYQPLFLRTVFIWLERLTAKFSDILIVVSEHDMRKGLMCRIGDASKYKIIRYGINYSEFKPDGGNAREKLGINSDDLVVGMVACFKPQKAPLDFVRMAFKVRRDFSSVKFILIGDGILRKKIERLIRRLGLDNTIILSGWQKDIPFFLSAIDVFVLTSLWEGFPIAILEAVSAGVPIVATNTGGICEIIKDGENGLLVKQKDIGAMAESLLRLLRSKDLRRRFAGQASRILKTDFYFQNMVEKTSVLYDNLITS